MDIEPQTTKPISDDQELAKVLAGVTQDSNTDLSFEETPLPQPTPSHDAHQHSEEVAVPEPEMSVVENPVVEPVNPVQNLVASGNLDGIKMEVITELKPLVEKLNLSAEEKFSIYLLIIRSTDDTSLIAPAHAAASAITDESKRAQALLDIIKEIDYLSNPR